MKLQIASVPVDTFAHAPRATVLPLATVAMPVLARRQAISAHRARHPRLAPLALAIVIVAGFLAACSAIARADDGIPPDCTGQVTFRAAPTRAPAVAPRATGAVARCTVDTRGAMTCGPMRATSLRADRVR